ncbi:hypothetical protein SAMN05216588_114104 [Pseudomonas flavescens]|uniref:Uncharacterized protein n=1 Tax=Phytopseudomonas flavescens TaxID=29435 RepID=A0A1G8JEE2_9GAMM|nr:hypothetical protein SAMN05216588_114104 [Pseudomonas flavescens]
MPDGCRSSGGGAVMLMMRRIIVAINLWIDARGSARLKSAWQFT